MFRTALTDIAHRGVPGLTGFFTGRGKSLAFTGTALAVAGAAWPPAWRRRRPRPRLGRRAARPGLPPRPATPS